MQKFEELAEQDKKRYEREMANYKPPSTSKSTPTKS